MVKFPLLAMPVTMNEQLDSDISCLKLHDLRRLSFSVGKFRRLLIDNNINPDGDKKDPQRNLNDRITLIRSKTRSVVPSALSEDMSR